MTKDTNEDVVPANAMGSSSSTSGPIRTFDPLLPLKKKKTAMQGVMKRKSLRSVLGQSMGLKDLKTK